VNYFCWTTVPSPSSLTTRVAFLGYGTEDLENGGLEKSYI